MLQLPHKRQAIVLIQMTIVWKQTNILLKLLRGASETAQKNIISGAVHTYMAYVM